MLRITSSKSGSTLQSTNLIPIPKKANETNVMNIDLVCVSGSGGNLRHLYLDLLGNCGCVLWQRHSQQAVFEFGKDLIAVHKGRQGEGAEEFTIVTFDAVKILALEFFVKLALSSQCQQVVFNRYVHILFLHFRQFHLENKFFLRLI